MKFSIASVLLMVTAAAAVPAADANNCVVNSAQIDEWVEGGLTRWRTAFSSENTPTDAYCKYWLPPNGCPWSSNVQCYYNTVVGSWVVDANFARGAGGDQTYWDCLGSTRQRWINDTGCRTG